MSGAQSISTRRAYGVQRVCRVWARPRSSVYARRQAPRDCARGHRRGPVGAAPDEVLVGHNRRVLEASPFHGEGYRKVWAKLRGEGIRTSPERVRRLMRAHDLQAPHRVGQAHGPTAHDGTITTETPDVMWGTDMTATVTVAEGAAFVFVAVDHCTAECIGLHAAKRGTRFEALEPIRQGVRERFGGIGDGAARGLDALTVADAVADVATTAGENVTTAVRADLKEFRAETETRFTKVHADIKELAGSIQSLQREIASFRWMIGVGFTLLSIFLAISTFIRSSGS